MIKTLKVTGLFGIKGNDIELNFNSDFNLITGRNGSGKTTILKILWYAMSRNEVSLQRETKFEKIVLETDSFEFGWDKATNERTALGYNKNNSLFFPTFRRMEGGFADDRDLKSAFNNLSIWLSSFIFGSFHKFVAYVSTYDIDNLLNAEKAKISETIQQNEAQTNAKLKELLRARKSEEALEVLRVQEEYAATANAKFEALEQLTDGYLEKRILLSGGLKIGKNEHLPLVSSENLSAGEKQFFAFLAYNAFTENTVIFIDEPELSLHPDWQRVLLKLLKSQNTTNQFIMATHSPFIYANYPDKEIELNTKKGDEL